MRSLCLILLAITLPGCTSEAKRAEQAYELAKANDLQPGDRCAAARRVKEAWLEQGDAEQYDRWAIEEYNACAEARRRGG